MTSPSGGYLWPVGSPESERHGPALPAGWQLVIGFNQSYWLGQHTGVDLSLPGESDYGVPCYAVADGVVTSAGAQPGTWGMVILIHHPAHGTWSQYAHLSAVGVRVGQRVSRGEQIGAVGNGAVPGQHGATVGSHLHFEIRRNDLPAGKWPSGRGKDQSAATRAYIAANYIDPMTVLGA